LDDIEKLEQRDVPLDAKFLQEDNDEIVKIEDPNTVPLNFRFVQLEDDDVSKMETMTLENLEIPLNMRFLHL
jgi:hypothetical protein